MSVLDRIRALIAREEVDAVERATAVIEAQRDDGADREAEARHLRAVHLHVKHSEYDPAIERRSRAR